MRILELINWFFVGFNACLAIVNFLALSGTRRMLYEIRKQAVETTRHLNEARRRNP